MIQTCPNCDQQLIYVNGNWRHFHTDRAVSCWTLHEVALGYTVDPKGDVEPEPTEVDDWAAELFAGGVTAIDTEEDEDVEALADTDDFADLLALLG